MPLSAQQDELLDTLDNTSSSDFWTDPRTLQEVATLRTDKRAWSRIMTAARRQGIVIAPWLEALEEATRHANGALPILRRSLGQPLWRSVLIPLTILSARSSTKA